jgi:polar amino acid transport system substrate-binding protein
MNKILIFFFIIGTLFSPICAAENTLRFTAVEKLPPFNFEENGKITGIDLDIFRELSKRVGFRATVELLPFKRIWRALQRGEVDGSLELYFNPKRESFVIYSRTPMRWSVQNIFIRKIDRVKYGTNRIEDLYGKIVGINAGFSVSTEFEKAAREKRFIVEEAKGVIENIKKLDRGRIDCYISNFHIAHYTINKLGLKDKIVALPEPFIPKKGVYFAISKKGKGISDKAGFMKKFNAALEEIHADGTYQKIVDKYIH